MRRDVDALANTTFDLVVIGGGVNGAFVAWDAALRGLRVALLEKGDFGQATSAASGRVAHGGLRHLQYGEFRQVRSAYRERAILRRIAPHLVRPLPFLIPSYGRLARGRLLLAGALTVYEGLTRGIDGVTRPPGVARHRVLSRNETLDRAPELACADLTGSVVYDECQIPHAERLTLAVVQAAHAAGAVVANYVESTALLRRHESIVGARAVDHLSGAVFDVGARVVANLAGPWADLVRAASGAPLRPLDVRFSKGVHIVTRPLSRDVALALPWGPDGTRRFLDRGGRHLFVMPWRGQSLIGATNTPYSGSPDQVQADRGDIVALLRRIHQVYPQAGLTEHDVRYAFAGLYPVFGRGRRPDRGYGAARTPRIYDHKIRDGIHGLITGVGVKYTTARQFAEQLVNHVFAHLGYRPPVARTTTTPVGGGGLGDLDDFTRRLVASRPPGVSAAALSRLVHRYGTTSVDLARYWERTPGWADPVVADRPTLKAEVRYAAREEMAQTMADVVFRRTGLGTVGNPGTQCLEPVAAIMGAELGWDPRRRSREIAEVQARFSLPAPPASANTHAGSTTHTYDGVP